MTEADKTDETLRLRQRVARLEEAIARIAREIEPAFRFPEVSFVALHRVATVARRTMDDANST